MLDSPALETRVLQAVAHGTGVSAQTVNMRNHRRSLMSQPNSTRNETGFRILHFFHLSFNKCCTGLLVSLSCLQKTNE